jgi:hypothetical protein
MSSVIPNSRKMPSTVASELPEPLRHALMSALLVDLSASDARQALTLWQPCASGQATALAGLSRFCRAVAREFGLQGREAEMHLRIIRALQAQVSGVQLREPPQEVTNTRPGRLEPQMATTSANDSVPPGLSTLTVQRFLEAVEALVERECAAQYTPGLWRQSLLRHAGRIPKALSVHLADWLWGRTELLQGDWPARGAGTRLINTAYVALAEWLGPVKADAGFTAIVREFENRSDQTLCDVRRYL